MSNENRCKYHSFYFNFQSKFLKSKIMNITAFEQTIEKAVNLFPFTCMDNVGFSIYI